MSNLWIVGAAERLKGLCEAGMPCETGTLCEAGMPCETGVPCEAGAGLEAGEFWSKRVLGRTALGSCGFRVSS